MSDAWISDALEQTWSSIYLLLRARDEAEFSRPTPCPGWSVKDIVAHLIGWERYYNEGFVPVPDAGDRSHVKNALGAMNEGFIDLMRTRTGAEVLGEFAIETARSLERLRGENSNDFDRIITSPLGLTATYRSRMETRIFDSWIHLQDLRDALLEPADDHSMGEEVVLARFEASLPEVIRGAMELEGGDVVRINLSGRMARSLTFRCFADRVEPVEFASESPVFELTTPIALFWRRCAGRISADALLGASATLVRGNVVLAVALADRLATTP